jgi:PAS domain S-box-containing protein
MPIRKTETDVRWAELAEELAGVGYWRMDATDSVLSWSPNMFRMMGFEAGCQPSLEEAMARIHPDDRNGTDAWLKHNLAGKTAFSVTRVIWPSGEVRYLEHRNACEYDDQGRIVAILGASIDVTERHQMQEAIAASEEHFRNLADACPDIITRCTLDGKLTYLSPAALTMLGYHPEEVLGKTAYDFMHPADVKRSKSRLAAYLAGGKHSQPVHLDCRMIHKRGHVVWIESSPRAILDPATGQVVEIQDIVRDVTEKKRELLRVA